MALRTNTAIPLAFQVGGRWWSFFNESYCGGPGAQVCMCRVTPSPHPNPYRYFHPHPQPYLHHHPHPFIIALTLNPTQACAWRVSSVEKVVNNTCLLDRIFSAVEAYPPGVSHRPRTYTRTYEHTRVHPTHPRPIRRRASAPAPTRNTPATPRTRAGFAALWPVCWARKGVSPTVLSRACRCHSSRRGGTKHLPTQVRAGVRGYRTG